MLAELGLDPKQSAFSIADSAIHQLTQLLRAAKFDAPDATCLSPAGEYNLRLGIIKVIHLNLVNTNYNSFIHTKKF